MPAQVQFLQEPTQWSDHQLKLAASRNRRSAMNLLVHKYREPLFRHALYLLKSEDEAYDVVQETFIRAFRETRLFDIDFRIKAWLFRVAKNLCLNQLRNTSRRSAILDANPQADRQSPDQLSTLFSGQQSIEMLGAMDKLSMDHREILVLRYFDELSYAEISQVLEVKLGTVMSRLSRARTSLLNVVEGGVLDDRES